MVTSKAERHLPACMFAHELLNKMGAIVSRCELLNERTEQGTEYARQLAVIRGIAESAVNELIEHQRRAEANETRKAG